MPALSGTVESGELTPSLKVKRKVADERYKEILAELYYFLLLALAAISYKAIAGKTPREYKLGWYVVLYFSAICVVFIAIARYHYPLMPFIAIYSGVGASVLLEAWSKRSVFPVMSPAIPHAPLLEPASQKTYAARAGASPK